MKTQFLLFLSISLFIFTSCSNDDDAVTSNETQVEIPATYSFERAGASTVSFSGQSTRIAMAEELASAFTDFDNLSEAQLLNMFANENSPFTNAELNSSSKSIKSKVAASSLYFSTNTALSSVIKEEFEATMSIQANVVLDNQNTVASPGIAGQIADGTSTRYVDENGLEQNQVFAKSLIGGLMLDQAINNYLSVAVLDEGENRVNNDNAIVEEENSYTTMEHKWDEAYGYVYGASAFPEDPNQDLGSDNFLNKYLSRVEDDADFAGIADKIYQAFKTGRAAIVAGDYDLRDAQVEILREQLSLVIGVRAIHYLMSGKAAIESEDFGGAFHDLSEGYGFIYSLQFTNNPSLNAPYVSRDEVQGYLAQLLAGENGLWDVDPQVLEEIAIAIATRFDIEVASTID